MNDRISISEWCLGLFLGAVCIGGDVYLLANGHGGGAAAWIAGYIVVLFVVALVRQAGRSGKVQLEEVQRRLGARQCPMCSTPGVNSRSFALWDGVDQTGKKISGTTSYGTCGTCGTNLVSHGSGEWEPVSDEEWRREFGAEEA